MVQLACFQFPLLPKQEVVESAELSPAYKEKNSERRAVSKLPLLDDPENVK